ncbi:class F sortase [Streptomyces sp. NBC_01808]|uniref:class F sortase n=1 Tax=Streptomyces sp. NBC_01808 TaxID=2975947 RepID=UPI002DDC6E94|nr:class F sortase [Streptomyces sp. NBC_01808]WSA36444.1 class F sortase [Streptomyces sp. NBC_01808]
MHEQRTIDPYAAMPYGMTPHGTLPHDPTGYGPAPNGTASGGPPPDPGGDGGGGGSVAGAPRDKFAAGVVICVMLLGIGMIHTALTGGFGPPQPSAESALTDDGPPAHPPLATSRPATIRIPAIGVDAPLTDVGLDPDGWLAAPPPGVRNLAGWYRDAATPGATGTAVVTGHVDDAAGPAVFYRLGGLKRGDVVKVDREDGRTAEFTVYAVEVFDAADFPSRRVYGDTDRAELRVLTCGGRYREGDAPGYEGNVVVFARLTDVA